MSNESSRRARELLRIALDLLDDEESLTAAAMISGALDVLERRTQPVVLRTNAHWRPTVRRHSAPTGCRSCA